MTTQQDDTRQGLSDLEFRSGTQQQVQLPSRSDPLRPNRRDEIEDEAARKAAEIAARRFRTAAGLPVDETPPAEEPAPAQQEPAEQPRDEMGRFASANPPEPGLEPQEAPEPAPQQVQQAPQPNVAELTPETLVKIKVNGVEEMRPWGEVQRSVQIESAARQRLEQANQLLQAARQQAQPAPQPQTQNPSPPVNDQAALVQELADKIAYGNKDDIAAVLQKAFQTPSTQAATVNPEAILQQVDQRLAFVQQQAAARSDLESFAREHDDIAKDPDLQQLVAVRVQRAMTDDLLGLGADPLALQTLTPAQLGFYHRQAQQFGARSSLDIMRDAASQVKGRFAPNSAPRQNPAIQNRLDAKRTAPQPLVAATPRVPAPQPDKPLSPAEIIAQERDARQQQRVGINARPR